ncbi:MAG: hypothetical protein ACE14V_11085 [bacterium]
MTKKQKQLSNPFSTGGGGPLFEAHVQSYLVVLMLTGGFAPCMPNWPISKIKLQGKFAGYDTDDLIVFVEEPNNKQQRKILGQIKHSVSISEKDPLFNEIIQAAWNDFNNSNLFSKGKDCFVLITGPLCSTDINDVRTILEWVRESENADEFIKKVGLVKFSSRVKQKKLQAFRTALKNANNGNAVIDEVLYNFLKHFYLLGFDLDTKTGVTLSFIHSLIGQYSPENTTALWTQIINEVQSANKNAGTISLESIPDDLRNAFKRQNIAVISDELATSQLQTVKQDWKQTAYASDLAIVNLLGSWCDKNENDHIIAQRLANKDYNSWIVKIREILQYPTNPIALKNGLWTITERYSLWQDLGTMLFDNNLDMFKQCIVDVLTERDPQFELPAEERYMANIHGKVLKHSPELRKGLAESLALLGNKYDVLTNCTQNKPETIAVLTLREIFSNADWKLWASLNDLLPLLAEAAPDEFLGIVENALQQSLCPFDVLFSQEGKGAFGTNYLTGLLWGLETLAWEEKYLVQVCVILGELASHDPGGNWANRPINSVLTILLPWHPQTIASIDKRKVALNTLLKENPTIAWKVLISLLHNQQRITMGSHKPSWRSSIPDNWKVNVTKYDYWEQVYYYGDLAVEMAGYDIEKLVELVNHLDNLSQASFEKVMKLLSSEFVNNKPENIHFTLWTNLTEFTSKHRRFSNAKWALNGDIVSRIESITTKFTPKNPLYLHRRLFNKHSIDLYEENGNWEEQQQKLEKHRQEAIKDIIDFGGIDSIITFIETVDLPFNVGFSLGIIAQPNIDSSILPQFLTTNNKNLLQFTHGFVWGRQSKFGWSWVDKLDKTDWSVIQISQFLSYLRFTEETWRRVSTLLGDSEREYWVRTNANPYEADCDLGVAIDKLIEYQRPYAAISCIFKIVHNRKPLDKSRSVKALLSALSSTESLNTMDVYKIVEIIKTLQNDPSTDQEDLFRVEWAYLSILNEYHGASPKLLENRLASDPAFFCKVIRLIYRSKKQDKPEKEPSEQQKLIASNAWTLLHEWRTPPGKQIDGSFSKQHFSEWLKHAKTICTESGHLEVALIHVGQVLFYSPPDPLGLWIDRVVADALNAKDAEEMRRGFSTEVTNSRGVHMVDPTGKPERELAEQYRKKAEEIDNSGYQRFAVTLRNIAEEYDQEANRIISEHQQESTIPTQDTKL